MSVIVHSWTFCTLSINKCIKLGRWYLRLDARPFGLRGKSTRGWILGEGITGWIGTQQNRLTTADPRGGKPVVLAQYHQSFLKLALGLQMTNALLQRIKIDSKYNLMGLYMRNLRSHFYKKYSHIFDFMELETYLPHKYEKDNIYWE